MGCTCSKKMYSWKLKSKKLSLVNYQRLLDERRIELLDTTAESESNRDDFEKNLVDEWIELTKERARVAEEIFEEETRHYLDHSLLQVHFWLDRIIKEKRSSHVLPDDFGHELRATFQSIQKYLVTRNIPINNEESPSPPPPTMSSISVPPPNASTPDSIHSSSPEADRDRRAYSVPPNLPNQIILRDLVRDSSTPIKSPTEGDYITPRDDRSLASMDTFDSAWSVGQMSKNLGLGGRFFPNAFSHQFLVAQRLSAQEDDVEAPPEDENESLD